MRIAKESMPYLVVGLTVALAAAALGFPFLSGGAFALSAFVAYFFRDPRREVPRDPDAIVSPGDGRVVEVHRDEAGRTRIAIFLSLFDVHINRAPAAGTVRQVDYRPGRFLPANHGKAGIENERNEMTLETEHGEIRLAQIAGVIARRIVCWKRAGDRVEAGERIGLIQFGSRLEVVLPAGIPAGVAVGARVQGGSSILARIPAAAAVQERRLEEASSR